LMMIGVYWSAPAVPEVPTAYHGKPVIIPLGCYSGPPEKAKEVLAPLRAVGDPIADLSGPMKWTGFQRFLDEDYPAGLFYYWKSIYINRLNEEVFALLADHTRKRPSPASSVDLWFLGGAFSRVPVTDTAFIQRQAPFMIGIEANWRDRAEAEANIAWARAVHQSMQRFSDGGNYLNFPGFLEDKEAMLRGAYGRNLERLQEIKARYDPGNLFPGLLNIPPRS
jgi:FAD/FMN-containing dehydrogenase